MDKIVIKDNKILENSIDILNNKIVLDNSELIITCDNSNMNIDIEFLENTSSKINILSNNSSNHINYHLNSNSFVIVNKLSINSSDEINIYLSHENSNIDYFNSILGDEDINSSINIFNNHNNTSCNVISHAINFSNKSLSITINGNISHNLINAKTYQDTQIINIKDGKNTIMPLLFINSNDIIANHSSYIGKFKKEDIFYLQSRGLRKFECYKLLIKGFLIGKMNLCDAIKEKFLIVINEWGDKIEQK